MDSLYILIPITFLLLGIAIAAYLWAVHSGQFDDLDRESSRILFDDDPEQNEPRSPAPPERDQ